MGSNHTYTIKFVALQTGLKPYLIRSWEHRYNAVRPQRSDTNRRVFCDADIRRLNLLKQAVSIGHAISVAARLTDGELQQLVGNYEGDANCDKISTNGISAVQAGTLRDSKDVVNAALFHILNLDAVSLEAVLDRAAMEMPRQAFLQDIVMALFVSIGELWRGGRLKAVNEHMASVIIRAMLWDMLRTAATPDEAPKIVVTTPVGHWHEFGALTAALAAAESGWRVVYFGANLPSDEIAYAAKKTNAKALALGICHRLNNSRLAIELRNLRRLVGNRLPIFIGGAGTGNLRNAIGAIDVTFCDDLERFRTDLDALTGASAD